MRTLVKAYPVSLAIKGQNRRAIVSVEVQDDDADFEYMDESLVEEIQEKLDKGDLVCLSVHVTVKFAELQGFEGFDALYNCFIRPSDLTKEVLEHVQDNLMESTASTELVAQVLQGVESINAFLKGA